MSHQKSFLAYFATGFGSGYAPFAPGTFGSIWGLPLVALMFACGLPWWGFLLVACGMFVVGVPICLAGSRHFDKPDPGGVVFDEIAAFPIVFCAVEWSVTSAMAGFVLFRFFDITKFWPIRLSEKLAGGLGIMIDDTIAGIYAAVCLWALMTYVV